MGGEHAVPNGVPLRRDLHRLFDLGYVTIRPDHRLAVSSALREHDENRRAYYQPDGQRILLPRNAADLPDPEFLDWHTASGFRA